MLSGAATGTPETRDGQVEAIRTIRVTGRGAVKARTQAVNQLEGLLGTAPEALRERLRHLPSPASIRGYAGHGGFGAADRPGSATVATEVGR